MVSGKLFVALAVGVVAVAALGVALGEPATLFGLGRTDAAMQAQVGDCRTFDAPGRYVLTADVNASGADACFVVRSSGVRIDGNGYEVRGVGNDSTGVLVPEQDTAPANVTVSDLGVVGFTTGVRVASFRPGEPVVRIGNVSVADGGTALDFEDGAGTVENVRIRGNERAVSLEAVENTTFRAVTIRNNGRGIDVGTGAEASFVDVTIQNNEGRGVFTDEQAGNSSFDRSRIAGNGGRGIVHQGRNLTLTRSVVRDNADTGLLVTSATATVADSLITDNGDADLRVFRGDVTLSNATVGR